MQDYFHPNTTKYLRFVRRFSVTAGIFLAMPVLLCFLSLILGYRELSSPGFRNIRIIIITGCIGFWLISSFVVFAAAVNRKSRVSRYTYLDIQKNAAVLSRYSGSWTVLSKRTYIRTLYIIPLVGTEIKYGNGRIVFKGDIKKYKGDSEWLGYHIKRGELKFDNWWLDNNGCTTVNEISLPADFAKAGFIYRCLKVAQNRSTAIAAKKKKSLGMPSPSAVRHRTAPRKRVYTEVPTFNRKW